MKEWDVDDHYREVTISVPEEEMDEGFFDAVVGFAHDFLRKRAVDKGLQSFDDCGDDDGSGCYGCNVIASARGVRP